MGERSSYRLQPIVIGAAEAHREGIVEYQDLGTVLFRHPRLVDVGLSCPTVVPRRRQFPAVRATFEDLEGALFALRNQFRRVFHSVEVQRVRQETGSVQAELGKMRQKVKEIDTTLGKRKLWGSVVIVVVVLLGVVFLLVRKTYEEEEKS